MTPLQGACLTAIAIVAGVVAIDIIRALGRLKQADPPAHDADPFTPPPDGWEGEVQGYYVRQRRAELKAEAIEAEMRASGYMTRLRLRESTKRLSERNMKR